MYICPEMPKLTNVLNGDEFSLSLKTIRYRLIFSNMNSKDDFTHHLKMQILFWINVSLSGLKQHVEVSCS